MAGGIFASTVRNNSSTEPTPKSIILYAKTASEFYRIWIMYLINRETLLFPHNFAMLHCFLEIDEDYKTEICIIKPVLVSILELYYFM